MLAIRFDGRDFHGAPTAASLALGLGQIRADDEGTLEFGDEVEAPFQIVRRIPGGLAVRFNCNVETRRKPIAKLFTGGYANAVAQIGIRQVFAAVFKRLAA